MTRGSGVTPPYGSNNREIIQTTPTSNAERLTNTNAVEKTVTFDEGDKDRVGGNVGGLVKDRDNEPEETVLKYATASDEEDVAQVEAYDKQVDDYMKAYEGEDNEKKSIGESIESAGEEYLSGLAVSPLYGAYKGYKAYRDARKGEQSGMPVSYTHLRAHET